MAAAGEGSRRRLIDAAAADCFGYDPSLIVKCLRPTAYASVMSCLHSPFLVSNSGPFYGAFYGCVYIFC